MVSAAEGELKTAPDELMQENPYLAMSVCELSSPSTVKGEPPVKSSYISTPRLHQSTAWNARKQPPMTEKNSIQGAHTH